MNKNYLKEVKKAFEKIVRKFNRRTDLSVGKNKILLGVDTRLEGRIWSFIVKVVTEADKRGYERASKAYGGCTKCYGKGYSTEARRIVAEADFEGDKSHSRDEFHIEPCTCDRGKQIRKLLDKVKGTD